MNGTALLLILVLLALLVAMNGFLRDRIARPAAALAHAAEGVAGGNFDLDFQASAEDDEIGRLSRAVGGMIHELRRLAGTIAASARETRAMSVEISAGTEEMAASAGEIASTASDLSAQANSMATSIGALAKTSVALRGVASALERGARDGVARNAALKTLALENRGGLDAGDQALATLAGDVSDSAHAVESLGAASEEIREFVALVRALARQSKLLSLNAAMEAARAGEHGKGFAVVAAEVRRLSTMSSEAADRTGTIMKAVLAGIERSRETSERALGTASDVRAATVRASSSFSEIERAVAESEAWTTTLEHAALETTELVREINLRIDELAGGTETFAAAMEQVAASSQEQSASTEQIAGAASSLGSASEKLSLIVGAMRVSGSQSVIQIPP
jgi:methyl-accepting chemotaxis protein